MRFDSAVLSITAPVAPIRDNPPHGLHPTQTPASECVRARQGALFAPWHRVDSGLHVVEQTQ